MSCYHVYIQLKKVCDLSKNKRRAPTSNCCVTVEPTPDSQSCPPPVWMITLVDVISNMPNRVIKGIVRNF